jgi:hypothetical protein
MIRHCAHCGHWHDTKCQAIAYTETGGARKCCCTGLNLDTI